MTRVVDWALKFSNQPSSKIRGLYASPLCTADVYGTPISSSSASFSPSSSAQPVAIKNVKVVLPLHSTISSSSSSSSAAAAAAAAASASALPIATKNAKAFLLRSTVVSPTV